MFKIAEKTELNQISLTGVRAIVLAGLLMVQPRSLDEIRKAFIDLNIMEDDNSDDILRIDLNTLKIMGCEISRASQKTDYKYVLGKHPFAFKMNDEQLGVLKKAYNNYKNDTDIVSLIELDLLLKKIASRICDSEIKEKLLGVSALRHFDIQTVKDLLVDCNQGRTLSLMYRKTATQPEEEKEIVAQKLVFQNDKIYLHGYDLSKQDTIVLHIGRITKILARKLVKTKVETKVYKIRYELESSRYTKLQEGETIIGVKDDNTFEIEGSYANEFYAAQRVLSLGSKCVVVEPSEFKNTIVTKLKEMRKSYGN